MNVLRSIAPLLGVALLGCAADSPPDGWTPPSVAADLKTIQVAGAGLATPAGIVHDHAADVYLVSNVDGDPTRHDGNGFISRLSPSGDVEELRWIDGARGDAELHAPKGMAIRGDTLYVADIECVRLFHRLTGQPASPICPPSVVSLNDVTADRDAVVYTTAGGGDGGAEGDAIYVIHGDEEAEPLFGGEDLGGPNGIAAGPNGIFFTTLRTGGIYQIRATQPFRVLTLRAGRLGGIAFTRDGSFAISSRSDSSVLYVEVDERRSKGQVWTLVRELPSPGDIAYDAKRHRILLTQLDGDALLFVDLPRG